MFEYSFKLYRYTSCIILPIALHLITVFYDNLTSTFYRTGCSINLEGKNKMCDMDMYGKISLQQQNVNILMSSHCGNHL